MQSECFHSLFSRPPLPHLFLHRQSFLLIFLHLFLSFFFAVVYLPLVVRSLSSHRIIITRSSRFSHEHASSEEQRSHGNISLSDFLENRLKIQPPPIIRSAGTLRPSSVFALIQSLDRLSTPFFLSFRHDVITSRYHVADDRSTRRPSPRILPKFLSPIRDTFGRSRGRKRRGAAVDRSEWRV